MKLFLKGCVPVSVSMLRCIRKLHEDMLFDFLISSFRRVLYVVCFLLGYSTHIYLPMKMEQTECSETSAYKLRTPGNYSKESLQHVGWRFLVSRNTTPGWFHRYGLYWDILTEVDCKCPVSVISFALLWAGLGSFGASAPLLHGAVCLQKPVRLQRLKKLPVS